MTALEKAKKDILESIRFANQKVNRQSLLYLLGVHQTQYKQKRLSAENKKLLDNAIISIWNDTYETNLTIDDIITNI